MLYQNTVFKKLWTEDGLWTDRTLQALCRFLILQSDTTYNIFTTTDAVGRKETNHDAENSREGKKEAT